MCGLDRMESGYELQPLFSPKRLLDGTGTTVGAVENQLGGLYFVAIFIFSCCWPIRGQVRLSRTNHGRMHAYCKQAPFSLGGQIGETSTTKTIQQSLFKATLAVIKRRRVYRSQIRGNFNDIPRDKILPVPGNTSFSKPSRSCCW